MNEEVQSRFASVFTALLGVWLVLSPIWISITGWALASLLIVGGLLILFGLAQMLIESTLPSWLVGLSVIWLAASAYIFDVSSAVIWNQVVSAVVGAILATWDGVEISQLQHKHLA